MATIVETGEGEGAIISSHEGEHSGDFNNGAPVPISSKTRMMAILAAGNSLLLGYDVGISPLVSQDVAGYWDLSNAQRGVFVGSIHVFMIVGAIVSPSVNDRFGRRACFCVSAVILVVGLVLLTTAESYSQVLVGRSIAGIGAGVGLGVSESPILDSVRCIELYSY